MAALNIGGFPTKEHLTRAQWAPVLIHPVLGSPEQFLIGVAVVNASGFHLEGANRFDRLHCLYSSDASSAVAAASMALDDLRDELAERGPAALSEYRPLFSGVTLGPLSEGEGQSLFHIAATWMTAMSSLYQADIGQTPALLGVSGSDLLLVDSGDKRVDRLPQLILRAIQDDHPILVNAFSREIRQSVKRRKNATGVSIDFAGKMLVANFSTLNPGNYASSVSRIKHRMWDLKVDRDKDSGMLNPRSHEMIVQYPAPDDPQITEKQSSRITDALGDLEKQADQEGLRFRPMTTVVQIAQHLVQRESAN